MPMFEESIANTNILVFIDGPFPSEDDLALAKKHGTKRFRNAQEGHIGAPEVCALAVAVDPSWIPAGYPTEAGENAVTPAAPAKNPTAPVAKGDAPKGPIVASEV